MGMAHNTGEPIAGRCLRCERVGMCFMYSYPAGSAERHFLPAPSVSLGWYSHFAQIISEYIKCSETNLCFQKKLYSRTDSIVYEISHLEKWNFLFYCNSTARTPGGVVGSHFTAALTSAVLSFAAAHMVDYYHFMVTVISNLVENDS